MNDILDDIDKGKTRLIAVETNKSKPGCLWVMVIIQSLIIFIGFFVVLGMAAVCSTNNISAESVKAGVDEVPPLKETWSEGNGTVKVVRIPLNGMIMLQEEKGMFGSTVSCATMALRSIRRATSDQDVKAIILEVDSGGGGITASDIIYKALKDFKAEDEDRRVIAVLNDMAASGAYYVSMAADHIIAHPTTVTGSIGVIIQGMNLHGLGEKIGIKDVTIKSGKNKDIFNPFQKLTEEGKLPPEQLGILQGIIDEMYDHFVGVVAEGRNMESDKVREIADGRIMSAIKAKELGLIDQIGYWSDAVEKTEELLGGEDLKIWRYEHEFKWSSIFSAKTAIPSIESIREQASVRMMYLWTL